MQLLKVSPSPHIKDSNSVKKTMYRLIIALIPALCISAFVFGAKSLIVTSVAIAACMLFEFSIQKYILKTTVTIKDGSAIVTGLLLAFNLPPSLPIWLVILGAFVAIAIGKMSFGGLGQNPFNPALVGRVFLLISFPAQMTTWSSTAVDAVSCATPLGLLKEGIKSGKSLTEISAQLPTYFDMIWGNMAGSIGEISAIALIIGGIYLLWKKVISWHIPITVLGSMALLQTILWAAMPTHFIDPFFHILTGGAMLGAIFMATDYSTSPMTPKGQIIYGIGIGIITICIRNFGSYPEGISFAILIMNGFTPLINARIKPKRFGGKN